MTDKKQNLKNFEKIATAVLNNFKKVKAGEKAAEILKDVLNQRAFEEALSLVRTEIIRVEKSGRPVETDESKLSDNASAAYLREWRRRTGKTKKPPSAPSLF